MQNNEKQAKTTDITEKPSQRNRQNNEKTSQNSSKHNGKQDETVENKTKQWKANPQAKTVAN